MQFSRIDLKIASKMKKWKPRKYDLIWFDYDWEYSMYPKASFSTRISNSVTYYKNAHVLLTSWFISQKAYLIHMEAAQPAKNLHCMRTFLIHETDVGLSAKPTCSTMLVGVSWTTCQVISLNSQLYIYMYIFGEMLQHLYFIVCG